MAAVRETFEECGILLARPIGGGPEGGLLHLPDKVRLEGRRAVHENRVSFPGWLRSVGGRADTENLRPWTRWITPVGPAKRYTTQMYLYMLPLPQLYVEQAGASSFLPWSTFLHPVSSSSGGSGSTFGRTLSGSTVIPVPTHDGGVEHTAASFDDAAAWLARARDGHLILFPPQIYLLTLLAELTSRATTIGAEQLGVAEAEGLRPGSRELYQAQRDSLLAFLERTPTSRPSTLTVVAARPAKAPHLTATIPWSQKVISPVVLFARAADGRGVLGLDKPGPELKGSDRGGDWDRVVLVRFDKGVPTQAEVRWREDVLREERETQGGDEEVADGRGKHWADA